MQSSWAINSLQNSSSSVCSFKPERSTLRADFFACFCILCMKSWEEQGSAGLLQVREEEEGPEEATQPFFVVAFNHLWQLLGRSCTAEEQRADPWIHQPHFSDARGQSYIFKMLPLFLLFQLNNKRIGADMTELRLCEKNFIFWLLPPTKTSSSAAVSDGSSGSIWVWL